MVKHLYILFQLLVSSIRKCPFGLETARFDGIPYGTEFDVLKFLSKTYFRICCNSTIKPCIFLNSVFFTKINVLFIKIERLVTLV